MIIDSFWNIVSLLGKQCICVSKKYKCFTLVHAIHSFNMNTAFIVLHYYNKTLKISNTIQSAILHFDIHMHAEYELILHISSKITECFSPALNLSQLYCFSRIQLVACRTIKVWKSFLQAVIIAYRRQMRVDLFGVRYVTSFRCLTNGNDSRSRASDVSIVSSWHWIMTRNEQEQLHSGCRASRDKSVKNTWKQ